MKILLCLAVILLAVEGLLLFLIFPAVRRHPDRKWLPGKMIAHRGLHDVGPSPAPENSIGAFREAVAQGYMIETDIHLTRDGQVVVFHDDTLRRMCGKEGSPESMTLAELKAMRLSGTDWEIPTLGELLREVDGKVPLLIEFKCRTASECRALCPAADAILQNYHGKYLIQSFYPFVLRYYRKHRPEICRGQLSTVFRKDKLTMVLLGCLLFNCIGRPDFVSYEHTHARCVFRRLCTVLGAFPIGWTFRSREEWEMNKKFFSTWIFENFLPDDEKTLKTK